MNEDPQELQGNGHGTQSTSVVSTQVIPVRLEEETRSAGIVSRGEIAEEMAIARANPRHVETVMKRIEALATWDEEMAASCMYALSRAGKAIKGPSIAFANVVASAWGNCKISAGGVFVDRTEKVVIAKARFVDLETNTSVQVDSQRRIVDKYGRLYNEDMIIITGNAATSVAMRNAILKGVSGPFWRRAYQLVEKVVTGSADTFADRKAKAIAAFAQFDVKPEQIFGVLGLRGEADLKLEHLPFLRGMYSALKNGEHTVEEMFDPRKFSGGFEVVDNPLADAPAQVGKAAQAPKRPGKPAGAKKAKGGKVATPKPKKRASAPKAGRDATPRLKAEVEKAVNKAAQAAADRAAAGGRKPQPDPEAVKAAADRAEARAKATDWGTAPLTSGEQAEETKPPPEETKPTPSAKPRSVAEYRAWVAYWVAGANDIETITERWKAERRMRSEAGMLPDDRIPIWDEVVRPRLKELGAE